MRKNIRKIFKNSIEKIKLLDNISLSNKLILSYVLILAVPITIFSFAIFRNFDNNSKKDVVNKNMYQLELEKVNIERNIEAMSYTAQMVISNRKLMDYIRAPYELGLEELVEFNFDTYKTMMQFQYSNPTISGINIFTDNKNVKEIWPLIFYEDRIKNKEWYKEVMDLKGKVFWNLNELSNDIYSISTSEAKGGEKVVAIYMSINYPQNLHNGIIRINIPADVFFSKMYSTVNDSEGQIFIINNKNKIYTNDESSFISQNNIDKELIKEEFLKNKTTDKNSFNIYVNKKRMVVAYTKIEALEGYMLNVASIEPMLKYTRFIRNIFIVGTLILIIILSIVTYFITYVILKRLYIIIQSMKRIQQGDFNVEIPVRSGDEIGELAHHFRKMLRKINELIQEAVNKRAVTKEAELRALQTQIDSHFIYNTLENIKMMAEIEGQYVISDSLTSLGDMMRYNMKWNSEYVTLSDEINHIKNYISLMNIRFDNTIKLSINIEEGLMEHEMLKMSLQPIVENTVKHGLREGFNEKRGEINIKAFKEGNYINIEVMDNGIGIEEDRLVLLNKEISYISKGEHKPGGKGYGIGLRNVNERIKLFYGDEYGIEVFSMVNLYTKVTMRIPY